MPALQNRLAKLHGEPLDQPTGVDWQLDWFMPADQEAARALILAGLEEHWGALDPAFNRDLDDIQATYREGAFLVARRAGRLLGTGALLPRTEDTAEIVRMSVAADERRKGIGASLLVALCDLARRAGTRRLILETTQSWTAAIAFYRAAGFRPTHLRGDDQYFEFIL